MSQIRISQRGGWLMACSNEVKKSGGLRCFYRLDSFFVRDRFIGHVGLLQNSIYNLLFQYNRTHFVHLLVVFVVPGHNLLRLLVSRSHFLNHFANACVIRLQFALLDHFSHNQAQHNAALGLLFKQLSWQLLRLEVATELLNSPFGTSIGLAASRPSITWFLTLDLIAWRSSRSMFLRTSARKPSRPPSLTPNRAKKSSFSSGS